MAVDTKKKRSSAQQIPPVVNNQPPPDGTIDAADRAQVSFTYGGLFSSASSSGVSRSSIFYFGVQRSVT